MGYMRHHALIVTTWNTDAAHAFKEQANKCRVCTVSEILESHVNGYRTIVVAPDGSKEGWEPSKEGDREREALIEWLDGQRYEDGSTSLAWVLVQYGDDDRETAVVDHSDTAGRREPHKEQGDA